ncbi:MAG: RNA-binding protein [Bacteroidota bacterium]|nr:RNA-binding protein [Bacteroidota bacterium]
MRIYIGNLNYRLRTEELKNAFLPFGEVIGAKIVRDQETKRSKGFGFVEMANEDDGLRAIEALNGQELNERKMIVTVAKPRENQTEANSFKNDSNES